MFISIPIAILAIIGLTQAISGLPTTVTCTNISSNCEEACGPGYKSCGSDQCYNPAKLETCCAPNITCPSGSFCNPEGKGYSVPSYGPPSINGTSMSMSMSMSMPTSKSVSSSIGYGSYGVGGYTFSGTSSAITSLSSLANGTISTATGAPANLSTPIVVTASSFSNHTTTHSPPSSTTPIPSGISMSTPVTNLTYSTSNPSTTTTVAAPANTGAAHLVEAGGVGIFVVVLGAVVAGWWL